MNTVTYTLENGVKIQQPINAKSFFDERGRKRTEAQMHKLFQETAWDKRARSYSIDSETNDSIIIEKEIHFSTLDKKLAKAQHKRFMKVNPEGFKKQLRSFQREFMDSINKYKRIKMNIVNINLQ